MSKTIQEQNKDWYDRQTPQAAKWMLSDGTETSEMPVAGSGGGNGGVSSFNTRTGDITPESGDYTYDMVGADAAGSAAGVQTALTTHTGSSVTDTNGTHGIRVNGGNLEYNSSGWTPLAIQAARTSAIEIPAETDVTDSSNGVGFTLPAGTSNVIATFLETATKKVLAYVAVNGKWYPLEGAY